MWQYLSSDTELSWVSLRNNKLQLFRFFCWRSISQYIPCLQKKNLDLGKWMGMWHIWNKLTQTLSFSDVPLAGSICTHWYGLRQKFQPHSWLVCPIFKLISFKIFLKIKIPWVSSMTVRLITVPVTCLTCSTVWPGNNSEWSHGKFRDNFPSEWLTCDAKYTNDITLPAIHCKYLKLITSK